jgi:hypothetical protein
MSPETAQRRKRIRTLSLNPLPATLQLKHALGIIVVQSIAGHVSEHILRIDLAASLSDHDGQFDLPIHVFAHSSA